MTSHLRRLIADPEYACICAWEMAGLALSMAGICGFVLFLDAMVHS